MAYTLEQHRENERQRRAANPQAYRDASKRWREAHPEEYCELLKRSEAKRVRDPEARRAYQAKWRAANAERLREQKRQWALDNPDKVKVYRKRRYAKQAPYLRQYLATHENARLRTLYRTAKGRAKSQGVEFTIEFGDIEWVRTCPVLGIALNYEFKDYKRGDDSPSLDRTRPELGYVKGNVVVMSWRANRIKYDSTLDEVEKLAVYMRKVRSN